MSRERKYRVIADFKFWEDRGLNRDMLVVIEQFEGFIKVHHSLDPDEYLSRDYGDWVISEFEEVHQEFDDALEDLLK